MRDQELSNLKGFRVVAYSSCFETDSKPLNCVIEPAGLPLCLSSETGAETLPL